MYVELSFSVYLLITNSQATGGIYAIHNDGSTETK